jgi:opacity protein-like surface antigen
VDQNLVSGSAELRTLRQVRLSSVLLGARWFPLRAARLRPFATAAAGSFRGREEGVLFGGADKWSKTHSAFGSQLGGGVDLDLTRSVTVDAHLSYNWMTRFSQPVSGRRDYRGTEFRIAASWRFGG